MSDEYSGYLTAEEVEKIRAIIKREEFAEEAQQRLITGAASFSKFIIEAGKVLATVAVAIALVKGWASDFILSPVGGRK